MPGLRRGIAHQKKVLKAGASSLEWIDVHSDNEAVENLDADLAFVRERLHVTDAEGKKHVGADAFTALWALLTPATVALTDRTVAGLQYTVPMDL